MELTKDTLVQETNDSAERPADDQQLRLSGGFHTNLWISYEVTQSGADASETRWASRPALV